MGRYGRQGFAKADLEVQVQHKTGLRGHSTARIRPELWGKSEHSGQILSFSDPRVVQIWFERRYRKSPTDSSARLQNGPNIILSNSDFYLDGMYAQNSKLELSVFMNFWLFFEDVMLKKHFMFFLFPLGLREIVEHETCIHLWRLLQWTGEFLVLNFIGSIAFRGENFITCTEQSKKIFLVAGLPFRYSSLNMDKFYFYNPRNIHSISTEHCTALKAKICSLLGALHPKAGFRTPFHHYSLFLCFYIISWGLQCDNYQSNVRNDVRNSFFR